jgi:hypothetical protein
VSTAGQEEAGKGLISHWTVDSSDVGRGRTAGCAEATSQGGGMPRSASRMIGVAHLQKVQH